MVLPSKTPRLRVALAVVSLNLVACGPAPESPGPSSTDLGHPLWWTTTAGVLPPEGAVTVGGVALPPGRPRSPDPEIVEHPEPLFWMTDEIIGNSGDLHVQLIEAFPETGLWPVVMQPFFDGEGRPWLSGEFGGLPDGDPIDAESFLAEVWNSEAQQASEDGYLDSLQPFGLEFPGLAPPSDQKMDPECFSGLKTSREGFLGLVPVTRPAEVPEAIGYLGAANYGIPGPAFTAVLSSWEDRFGAVLVAMDFSTMVLLVCRPVTSTETALLIAAETLAFDPDAVWQGTGSIPELAQTIHWSKYWGFWWD